MEQNDESKFAYILLNSPGWKLWIEILNKHRMTENGWRKFTTLKELQAAQKAEAIIDKALAEFEELAINE